MSSHKESLGIVVGVDGSPASKVAVYWAARDADLRKLRLTLVHAAPVWPVIGRSRTSRRVGRIVGDAVNVASESTSRGGPMSISTRVVFGDPVTALVELSRDAEMIVVGSRGRGALRRRLLGSVSAALVRQSHCPVAVIHDEDPLMAHPAQAPVLVRADSSAASQRVTALAREEARRRGVELIVSEEAAPRLIEESESAQLVVVNGEHRRRSVGAIVAQSARMPVIVA